MFFSFHQQNSQMNDINLKKIYNGGFGSGINMMKNANLKVNPRPNPMIKVNPKPNPMIKVNPKPNPMIKVNPRPNPMMKVNPRPNPMMKVNPRPNPMIKATVPLNDNLSSVVNLAGHNDKDKGKKIGICFHVGNIEVFKEIYNEYYSFFNKKNVITCVSIYDFNYETEIKKYIPNVHIIIVENKGMDIGGFLKVIEYMKNNNILDSINYLYKLHTKTNNMWRNKMMKPLIVNENQISEIMTNEYPIIIGSKDYLYFNNKVINRKYIKNILNRNKNVFGKYFTENEISSYYDTYNDMYDENDENEWKNILYLNKEFYKYYEKDLNGMSDQEAELHWKNHGTNEFHRINNPNYIKKFGEDSFFIAGTIFCCNHRFLKILSEIDIDNEYHTLEDKYVVNDIPRRTHAWEYFFGLLCTALKGKVIGIDITGNVYNNNLDKKNFSYDIYKNCNSDLSDYDKKSLHDHYIIYGCKEKRICCKYDLEKRQSIINVPLDKAKVAFFMLMAGDNGSGGYRTLLRYINYLEKNGLSVDIYYGHNTDSMKTYNGLSILSDNLENILNVVDSYGEINIENHNHYLGLNAQRKYDILVANAWQIAEAVYLNRMHCNKLAYIIQDLEYLFYPENNILQEMVKKTYKQEFNYYCLSKYLHSKFKNSTPSILGSDHSIYNNQNINRENSIIIAYYKGKPGRMPKLIESIIKVLYKQYKLYIYPDTYNSIVHQNIINMGKMTTHDLNKLYNKGKIGVVMSNTNPSRLGFEMISSGLKVIEYNSVFTSLDMPDNVYTKIDESSNILSVVKKLIESDIDNKEYVNSISTENENNIMLNFFNKLMSC